MARRKKQQEESYETADGFQIEDMEGNVIDNDEQTDEEAKSAFWADDDDDEQEEDDYFSSVAENNDWEEGYDY